MTSERQDRAVALFDEGFSCAQAVCQAFCSEYGLSPADASRCAAGFGGGLARTDRTCGAVTGAVIVLGLALGGTSGDDRASKETTYTAVQEFLSAFEAAHGSVECTALLGFNLADPADAAAARRAGAVPRVCPGLVRSAVALLEEILPPHPRA